MDCTICVAKTKALISFAVTAKLICAFVKFRFSHGTAQLTMFSPICEYFETDEIDIAQQKTHLHVMFGFFFYILVRFSFVIFMDIPVMIIFLLA